MNSEFTQLHDTIEDLNKVIQSDNELIRFQHNRIEHLEKQVRLLKSKLFGRKSEKPVVDTDDKQLSLFDEAEDIAEEAPANEDKVTVAGHSRKKGGRKPLPEDLPRIEVIHDIPEEEKTCACGCEMSRIGEDVSEKLDIIPAKIQVIRHIRYKYACKQCEGVESEEGAVKTAPLPPQLIPQSISTPGLLAHILTAKFADGLPFYRQEKQFVRIGVDLPRATMANWAIQAAKKCQPLIDCLIQEIRSGPLIGMDETTVQVLQEPGRNNTSKSYMWVFRGGDPDKPALIYQYHPTRSGEVPKNFINGYRGYIQTDGYKGYNGLAEDSGIIHIGCWAHARRKFHEVIKARQPVKKGKPQKPGSAEKAMSFIGKLYQVESRADKAKLSPDQRRELRQAEAEPALEAFKKWLDKRSQQTPPQGLLGKAINYTLDQWDRLTGYVQDGRLRPDNNLVENAIRPFVLGRKNWLFSGHPRGADASAAIFSLIETSKANGLEPYAYLRYIFEQLPLTGNPDDYKKLLPQHLDPAVCALRPDWVGLT
jgi:transposase